MAAPGALGVDHDLRAVQRQGRLHAVDQLPCYRRIDLEEG